VQGGAESAGAQPPPEAGATPSVRAALVSKPVLAALAVVALGVLTEKLPYPLLRIFSAPPAAPKLEPSAPAVAREAGEAELTESTSSAALATPERPQAPTTQTRFGGAEAPLDWSGIETEKPPVPI